jgi:hypothetical protein
MDLIAKYSKWLTLAAAIILILSCFMEWSFYPDLNKSFTGWVSERNIYGKPAKFLTFMAVFAVLAQFLPSLFLKRANLLLMALNLAYAIKTFITFSRCYSVVCPEKQTGIYIMIIASAILMLSAVLPSGKLKAEPGVKLNSGAVPEPGPTPNP